MFGMPRRLLFGYLALAVFMTGDGFELTFLSRFLVENGFSPTQAGLAFTVYGFVVALSAWTTGVLAEVVGAKRLMVLGGALWMVLHVLFLTVGLQSVVGAIVIYSLRGVAYPLFMYSFVVLIAQSVQPGRLASAMGWFWSSFSLGIGVMGAYVPSAGPGHRRVRDAVGLPGLRGRRHGDVRLPRARRSARGGPHRRARRAG